MEAILGLVGVLVGAAITTFAASRQESAKNRREDFRWYQELIREMYGRRYRVEQALGNTREIRTEALAYLQEQMAEKVPNAEEDTEHQFAPIFRTAIAEVVEELHGYRSAVYSLRLTPVWPAAERTLQLLESSVEAITNNEDADQVFNQMLEATEQLVAMVQDLTNAERGRLGVPFSRWHTRSNAA